MVLDICFIVRGWLRKQIEIANVIITFTTKDNATLHIEEEYLAKLDFPITQSISACYWHEQSAFLSVSDDI